MKRKYLIRINQEVETISLYQDMSTGSEGELEKFKFPRIIDTFTINEEEDFWKAVRGLDLKFEEEEQALWFFQDVVSDLPF